MTRSEHHLYSAPGNPRNSEGSFVTLDDGRILFIYSRFNGEDWRDNCNADIACCHSSDDGRTWSDSEILFHNDCPEGNLMGASLLRLADHRIALMYGAKRPMPGENYVAYIPVFRYSDDDAKTWSPEQRLSGLRDIICLNNDRLVQLKSGRLLMPNARITVAKTPKGTAFFPLLSTLMYSDDGGANWYDTPTFLYPPQDSATGLQEPGVIELNDGRLMMWARTDLFCQYRSFSFDQGMTWTAPQPWRNFASPVAPLSLKRDPADGKLVAVWVDADPGWGIAPVYKGTWRRAPLAMAISRDDGATWENRHLLEDDPTCGYCYAAIHFTPTAILLAYCCGGRGKYTLQDTKIVRLPR